MRRLIGMVVLLAGFSAGATIAQDGPITIKIKKAGPGDVIKETKTESGKTKIVITAMGMDQTKVEDTHSKMTFTDEVIAKPKDAVKPTKVKRTYETAELTKGDAKVDLDLEGKTVMIELKGEDYAFTIDGKAVRSEAADLLKKEFSPKKTTSEEDFLPGKPVKVGDNWEVNIAKAVAEFAEGGFVVDANKSKANGKLVKVYDKAGAKYGVIEIDMDLVVTKLKAEQEIPLKDGSKMKIKLILDACIDGSTASSGGTMTMKGELAGEVMGIAIAFGLDMKVGGKSEQLKK